MEVENPLFVEERSLPRGNFHFHVSESCVASLGSLQPLLFWTISKTVCTLHRCQATGGTLPVGILGSKNNLWEPMQNSQNRMWLKQQPNQVLWWHLIPPSAQEALCLYSHVVNAFGPKLIFHLPAIFPAGARKRRFPGHSREAKHRPSVEAQGPGNGLEVHG